MNKTEEKHLEAIKKEWQSEATNTEFLQDSATSCASITKEYAMKFDVWKKENKWEYSAYYDAYFCSISISKTIDELWDLFLNDLNEKG